MNLANVKGEEPESDLLFVGFNQDSGKLEYFLRLYGEPLKLNEKVFYGTNYFTCASILLLLLFYFYCTSNIVYFNFYLYFTNSSALLYLLCYSMAKKKTIIIVKSNFV